MRELRHLGSENSSYPQILRERIRSAYLRELAQLGVLSLAEQWSSALMWSHYGDQHAGICIEFSTVDHLARNLRKVSYSGTREISLVDLAAWKAAGDKIARTRVMETSLWSKSPAWRYEKEWRVVSESPGLRSLPFDVTGIYFGERCPPAVRTMMVRALHDAMPSIRFYDVCFSSTNFDLTRQEICIDEVLSTGIMPSPLLIFGRQPIPALPDGTIPLTTTAPPELGEPYLQR